jgi:phosphatidate cytidylyltransferase
MATHRAGHPMSADGDAMNVHEFLHGPREALHDPLILGVGAGVAIAISTAAIATLALHRRGRIGDGARRELLLRCGTWAALLPMIAAPILLGPLFVVVAVGLLSIVCYREYARATGLFRCRLVHVVVVVGILAIAIAAAHDRYPAFVLVWPLIVGAILAGSILLDRPRGYLQRTSLGMLGFALFGVCFGYVSLLANEPNFRLILIWMLLAVEFNDVFAFIAGQFVGGPKLRPNTSPNKKLFAGVIAILMTTLLVVTAGRFVFAGQPIGAPGHLIALGVIISIAGQLGDLVLSSIKRDLRIKDMAAALPGHGGWLDRFDSLILVAPAVYYYITYFQGGGPTSIGVVAVAGG